MRVTCQSLGRVFELNALITWRWAWPPPMSTMRFMAWDVLEVEVEVREVAGTCTDIKVFSIGFLDGVKQVD